MNELSSPTPQSGWTTVVNENVAAGAAALMYARNYATSAGLVLGYFGGHIAGSAIADGTTTLAASEANVYVVAHRTTGAVTSATNTTNWDNTSTYGRLYHAVTGGSTITTLTDWRHQTGGWFDRTGSVSVDAEDVSAEPFAPTRSDAGALTGAELLPLTRLSSITYTATTISAQASDNSFNDSASQFVAEGFAVGQSVRVQGFTGDVANNIFTGRITVLTTGKMTIGGTDGDVIVDDAAGESVTITAWESVRGTAAQVAALAAGGANPHLRFTSDTGSTADSDPGSGLFKWNNATQASATVIFIDDNEASGQAVTTFIGGLEPGGYLFLQQADDATRWQHWRITSITDASGYTKFGVSLLAKGSDIQDDKACIAAISTGVCETWAFACSDYKTTAIAAATDVGGMIAPYAATVFNVWAGLHTAQTSGSTLTVDVNEGASPTSILSSKITFDNTENWSGDDASLPVISDASIAAGAKITADVDAVGDGTAKGLTVYLRVFRT